MQFFDRLIRMLDKKLDHPNKVITIKECMDMVNDLLQFSKGKLIIIQNKMKVSINSSYSLILSILSSDNQIKDWNESTTSFYHIVNFPQVASIFQGDTDEFSFNELIDTLFKVET